MRHFLQRLDSAMECLATGLYGPLDRFEEPPGLGTKLLVFGILATLMLAGLACTWGL
jgi:hypothetical protein